MITIRVDVPGNCVTNHFIGEQILINSGIFMYDSCRANKGCVGR